MGNIMLDWNEEWTILPEAIDPSTQPNPKIYDVNEEEEE
jgi:hypothetical protein